MPGAQGGWDAGGRPVSDEPASTMNSSKRPTESGRGETPQPEAPSGVSPRAVPPEPIAPTPRRALAVERLLLDCAEADAAAAAGFFGCLQGTGLLSTQLNDYRLYLPIELRRRLGHWADLPWVVSFWCEGCLRAIPESLWGRYLGTLRHQLEKLGYSEEDYDAYEVTASVVHLEHGGRWHLPHSLAKLSNIDGGTLCWLCATGGGIEIWDSLVKQERLRSIASRLNHRLAAGRAGSSPAAGAPGPAPKR